MPSASNLLAASSERQAARSRFPRHQLRYALTAYGYMPVTFLRRVAFGNDPYWRRFFWSRWGFVSPELRELSRSRRVLWIDALSGGEVTQSVTFCRLLREALPDWALVFSSGDRPSLNFARANLPVDHFFDSPWDCVGPVRRALGRIRPTVLVCIQNVHCPTLVREAHRAGVGTVLVSGLMSKEVHRHPLSWRAAELRPYPDLDGIGAWGVDDVKGFVSRGAAADRVVVAGNMKFDFEFLRVSDAEQDCLRASLGLKSDERVFLAANVHPGEEEFVGRAFVQARGSVPGLRLVVVPRYRFHVPDALAKLSALNLDVRTKTSLGTAPGPHDAVVVVDTFGELARLYSIASVVFLAGTTYTRNVIGMGQSPIEALAQGKPLFFGPVMNLWREITDELKAAWPGVEVTDSDQLAAGIRAVLSDPDVAQRINAATQHILRPHDDDVRRNVDVVLRAVGAMATA